MGERRIGGLQRHVGAATHRNAKRCRLHCRGVVNPVPDHRQRRMRIQGRYRLHFIGWQQPRPVIQRQLTGNGCGGARVIAGQDHAVDAELMQGANGLFRVITQGITQGDQTFCLAVLDHHHYRLPGLLQSSDLRYKVRSREFICRANEHLAARDFSFDPRAHQRPLAGSRRNSQPAGLRFTHNRLRQRVGGTLLYRGGERQQILLANLVRINARHLRLAHRQGAGLVERHLLHLRQLLQCGTALNQRPTACGGRQSGGDGRRGGDHQRTRAANQQQGQPFVDPALPGRAEQQRRHYGHQQGNQHNHRGIDPAEAVDEALHRGAALFRLFDQLQDAVDSAVARFGQDRQLYQTIDAGGPRRDFFARRTVHRNGFAGEGAFIKAGRGGEQRPVSRQTTPGGNFNHIPRTQRGNRHGFAFAINDLSCGFRLQRHQRADPFTRPACRPAFEPLANQKQQQDHRRFRRGADKQRPDGGHAHQGFNGEPAAAFHQAQRLAGHRPEPDQGGGDKGEVAERVVELLQPPAYAHQQNQRDERQIVAQHRGFFGGSVLIAQRIARIDDRRFDLGADVAAGIDQQFFGGKQDLDMIDARHLADGGFHFEGAGGTVHAVDHPAVTLALDGRHGFGLHRTVIRGAAGLFGGKGGELKCRKLRHFFWRFWSRHGTLRQ